MLDRWPSPAELKGKVIIRDKVKHKQDEVKNASFGVGKVFEAISSRGKSSREASTEEHQSYTFNWGKQALGGELRGQPLQKCACRRS